jgi:hypothetical protein
VSLRLSNNLEQATFELDSDKVMIHAVHMGGHDQFSFLFSSKISFPEVRIVIETTKL